MGLLVALCPAIAQTPTISLIPDGSQYLLMQENSLRGNCSPVVLTGTPIVRVITAYNPVEAQTDDTPCIAASGLNICETRKNIVASNEFPFGTRLLIEGEIYYVEDRTNSRYQYRVDILMDSYEEARKWGIQTKEIILLD
jgi:3D (Asp-Asp-Asp) domain-containing protein